MAAATSVLFIALLTVGLASWTPSPQIQDPEADPSVDNQACLRCHDLPRLVATKRPGYDHFESAHGLVLERQDHCVSCHAEFVPVDMESHRFDRAAQVDNCLLCH